MKNNAERPTKRLQNRRKKGKWFKKKNEKKDVSIKQSREHSAEPRLRINVML